MPTDLEAGLEGSAGDPKALLVLNAVLSSLFAYTVLWLSDFAGLTTFTWGRFVGLAVLLMVLAFVVSRE